MQLELGEYSCLRDLLCNGGAIASCFHIVEEFVWETAVSHEVASTIAWQVAQQDGWQAVPLQWRQVYDETEARISAYLAELDQIAARLAQAGIPLVALKNSGIVRGIFPHPGAVPMGDVDVLVRPGDFRHAHAILLENGYHFEFRSELEEEDLTAAEQGGGRNIGRFYPTAKSFGLNSSGGRWPAVGSGPIRNRRPTN